MRRALMALALMLCAVAIMAQSIGYRPGIRSVAAPTTSLFVYRSGNNIYVQTAKQRWTVAQNPVPDAYGSAEWHTTKHEAYVGGSWVTGYVAISDTLISANGNWQGSGHANMADPSSLTWTLDGGAITPSSIERHGNTLTLDQTATGYGAGIADLTARFVTTWTGRAETVDHAVTYTAIEALEVANIYTAMTEYAMCSGGEPFTDLTIAGAVVLSPADCPGDEESFYQLGPSISSYSLVGTGGSMVLSGWGSKEFLGVGTKAYVIYATTISMAPTDSVTVSFTRALR